MLKSIQFECKKVIKSPIFFVVIFGMLLITIAYYMVVFINADKIHNNKTLEEQNTIANFESYIEASEQLIDSGKLNEGEIQVEKDQIQLHEYFIDLSESKLKGYESGDWTTLLDTQIEFDEQMLEQERGKDVRSRAHGAGGQSVYTLKTNIEQNKLLRERKLTPVLPVDFSLTVYDEPFESTMAEKEQTDRAAKYGTSGLYYLYMFINLVFNVFGVIFMLFLFGDMITKEGLGHHGPIHLLWTQPIKRLTVPISKMVSTLVMTAIILTSTIIFVLMIGTVFNQFGDGNYPIHMYQPLEQFIDDPHAFITFAPNETISFMNLSTFLIQSSVLFLMVLLFAYALLFLSSILTKQTLGAVGGTIIIILAGMMLSGQTFFSKLAPYFPFSYFSVGKVVTKEVAVTIANFQLTFTTGMIVLPIYSILILLLSFTLFNNASKRV